MTNNVEYIKALSVLDKDLIKVLKVNYVNGTYDILKTNDKDLPKTKRAKENIIAWVNEFIENYNALDINLESHKLFYNLKTMQNFLKNRNEFSILYKRKMLTDNIFNWVMLKLIKIDNKELYLYIINVHYPIAKEMESAYKENIEKYLDKETKFKNRTSFNEYVKNYDNRKIGLMYFHILDEYQVFSKIIRERFASGFYRLTNSDFIIICDSYSKSRLNQKYTELTNIFKELGLIIGSSKIWKNNCEDLNKLVKELKDGK